MLKKLKGFLSSESDERTFGESIHKWERHFWCNCCVKPIEAFDSVAANVNRPIGACDAPMAAALVRRAA
jgi:hypothetical protein